MMLTGSFQWSWWCICWRSWWCQLSWASSSSKGECWDLGRMPQCVQNHHESSPATVWYWRAVQRLADCWRCPRSAVKPGVPDLRTLTGLCTWTAICLSSDTQCAEHLLTSFWCSSFWPAAPRQSSAAAAEATVHSTTTPCTGTTVTWTLPPSPVQV